MRAALLCERVLCETDGTLSAIRIVHEGPVAAEPTRLVLLLMLVRGDVAPGVHRALLQLQGPTGEIDSRQEIALTLDEGGPEQASSLMIDVTFAPRRAGVHWFRVSWGDEPRLLTRVPYTAVAAGQGGHVAP